MWQVGKQLVPFSMPLRSESGGSGREGGEALRLVLFFFFKEKEAGF